MNELKISRTEIKDEKGNTIHLVYDENEDMLDIRFGEKQPATGIELTDQILLRMDQSTGRAVSLTLHHFSILIEQTGFGPRSYPLENIKELPEDLQEQVVRVLTTAPVNKFMKTSFFQESPTKQILLTYVQPFNFASVA